MLLSKLFKLPWIQTESWQQKLGKRHYWNKNIKWKQGVAWEESNKGRWESLLGLVWFKVSFDETRSRNWKHARENRSGRMMQKSLQLEKYSNETLTWTAVCYLQSMLGSTIAEELEAEANTNKSEFIWEKCRTAYLRKTIQTTRIQCTRTDSKQRCQECWGNSMSDRKLWHKIAGEKCQSTAGLYYLEALHHTGMKHLQLLLPFT